MRADKNQSGKEESLEIKKTPRSHKSWKPIKGGESNMWARLGRPSLEFIHHSSQGLAKAASSVRAVHTGERTETQKLFISSQE